MAVMTGPYGPDLLASPPLPMLEDLSDFEDGDSEDTRTRPLSPQPSRPLQAFFPVGKSDDGKTFYSIRTLEEVDYPSNNASTATLGRREKLFQFTSASSSGSGRTTPESTPAPLPKKRGSRLYRWLRWGVGTVYRRIFTLAYVTNLAVLVALVVQAGLGLGNALSYETCATAVSANMLACLLVRNEHVVNAMFQVFGIWPKAAPLFLRRLFAKVYSYGGIHSGCGVSATFWFIAYLVLVMREFTGHGEASILRSYTVLVGYTIVLLLVTILLFSHPRLRILIHNWFEGIHRYMGWSVVILFWAQVLMLAADSASTRQIPVSMAVVMSPSFWMLIMTTLLVIYPWTHLRLRDVEAEPLSDHVIKLNFDYADVKWGQAVRLSDAPLKETHAFAVIPKPRSDPTPGTSASNNSLNTKKSFNSDNSEKAFRSDDSSSINDSTAPLVDKSTGSEKAKPAKTTQKGFSVLVSNAGDWTNKVIQNPPKKMWTRGVPQYGVLRVAGLFKPCIIMATGSGIGPCLSLFVQKPDHPVRIIWSTPNPVETYGQSVIDLIYKTDPSAIIHDTRKEGRPDLVAMAHRVWDASRREGPREFALSRVNGTNDAGSRKPFGQCEAIVIISNQKVTTKVVYGLESRGIPAYGAIFDS